LTVKQKSQLNTLDLVGILMNDEKQVSLVAALHGMAAVSSQVNKLLDGYEYLVDTFTEIDESNLFRQQLLDARTSFTEISEIMILIKRMVSSIHQGCPLHGNQAFKKEVLDEFILHLDMIRNLLKDYEIHPEGYSASTIATAIINIRHCLMSY
jgi:hypothetical protein